MTTLMRNGRAVRSGKPVVCHATNERVLLIGTRPADHIMASGHSAAIIGRIHDRTRPTRQRQIPLATRAPSIHGTQPNVGGSTQAGPHWGLTGSSGLGSS